MQPAHAAVLATWQAAVMIELQVAQQHHCRSRGRASVLRLAKATRQEALKPGLLVAPGQVQLRQQVWLDLDQAGLAVQGMNDM
jgi:hypothetical protein